VRETSGPCINNEELATIWVEKAARIITAGRPAVLLALLLVDYYLYLFIISTPSVPNYKSL
jgi:hypothetical protein